MKTGAEGYAEVQTMAKVDVVGSILEARSVFTDTAACEFCDHELQGRLYESAGLVGDLVYCARTILRTGFTIEDHKRLAAILGKIA